MNILRLQNLLKNFSDEQLSGEMQTPTGNVPQFLVLTEMQRRKDMRDDFSAAQTEQSQTTVAEDMMRGESAPGTPPSIAAPPSMAGLGALSQMPQQQPQQQPVRMQEGGMTQDNDYARRQLTMQQPLGLSLLPEQSTPRFDRAGGGENFYDTVESAHGELGEAQDVLRNAVNQVGQVRGTISPPRQPSPWGGKGGGFGAKQVNRPYDYYGERGHPRQQLAGLFNQGGPVKAQQGIYANYMQGLLDVGAKPAVPQYPAAWFGMGTPQPTFRTNQDLRAEVNELGLAPQEEKAKNLLSFLGIETPGTFETRWQQGDGTETVDVQSELAEGQLDPPLGSPDADRGFQPRQDVVDRMKRLQQMSAANTTALPGAGVGDELVETESASIEKFVPRRELPDSGLADYASRKRTAEESQYAQMIEAAEMQGDQQHALSKADPTKVADNLTERVLEVGTENLPRQDVADRWKRLQQMAVAREGQQAELEAIGGPSGEAASADVQALEPSPMSEAASMKNRMAAALGPSWQRTPKGQALWKKIAQLTTDTRTTPPGSGDVMEAMRASPDFALPNPGFLPPLDDMDAVANMGLDAATAEKMRQTIAIQKAALDPASVQTTMPTLADERGYALYGGRPPTTVSPLTEVAMLDQDARGTTKGAEIIAQLQNNQKQLAAKPPVAERQAVKEAVNSVAPRPKPAAQAIQAVATERVTPGAGEELLREAAISTGGDPGADTGDINKALALMSPKTVPAPAQATPAAAKPKTLVEQYKDLMADYMNKGQGQRMSNALLGAGAAMLGSKSPYFGQALGAGISGGLAAEQQYQKQLADRQKSMMNLVAKQAELDIAGREAAVKERGAATAETLATSKISLNDAMAKRYGAQSANEKSKLAIDRGKAEVDKLYKEAMAKKLTGTAGYADWMLDKLRNSAAGADMFDDEGRPFPQTLDIITQKAAAAGSRAPQLNPGQDPRVTEQVTKNVKSRVNRAMNQADGFYKVKLDSKGRPEPDKAGGTVTREEAMESAYAIEQELIARELARLRAQGGSNVPSFAQKPKIVTMDNLRK